VLERVDIQDSHGRENLIQAPFRNGALNDSAGFEGSPVASDGTHLPGKKSDPGRTGADKSPIFGSCVFGLPGLARRGAIYRMRLAIGNSVFIRFFWWSKDGVFDRLFTAMADDPDFEYVMIDLHHRPGPPTCGREKRGPEARAIGRSRGD